MSDRGGIGSGRGGRGAYFKARYGNKSRGRGGPRFGQQHDGSDSGTHQGQSQSFRVAGDRDWMQLAKDLEAINGRQYGHYNTLRGSYQHSHPSFALHVDHVQGDPYAAPSRVRVRAKLSDTGLPTEYLKSNIRKIALCDYVTRVAGSLIQAKHLDQNVGNANGGWSGPKGGAFSICMPGQQVLPRSSAMITSDCIELRFTVSLPAAGRSILGELAHKILVENLGTIVEKALFYSQLDSDGLAKHIRSAEQQQSLREQLSKQDLLSFIANGSILPRASGASQGPMSGAHLVPFQSPKELEVALVALDGPKIVGMGIPRGVTMLTGGGFHGKSTLLEAIELGIYNHVPGDGRERVVTDPSAFKIRAEDGRSITNTDISSFITQLPGGKNTSSFSTEDASGSTSMAANIQEALEVGCKTLLIDEDSSATNLLVRDRRMETLIRNEPITPLISKVRALYREHGVSTVIVIGGLGDWLAVADHVIAMDSYVPRCITAQAKQVVSQFPTPVNQDTTYGSIAQRTVRINLDGLRSPWAMSKRLISIAPQVEDAVDDPSKDRNGIDLGNLDQIVEIGQSRTIAKILGQLDGEAGAPLTASHKKVGGLLGIDGPWPATVLEGDWVAVRALEVVAAISRLRGSTLQVSKN